MKLLLFVFAVLLAVNQPAFSQNKSKADSSKIDKPAAPEVGKNYQKWTDENQSSDNSPASEWDAIQPIEQQKKDPPAEPVPNLKNSGQAQSNPEKKWTKVKNTGSKTTLKAGEKIEIKAGENPEAKSGKEIDSKNLTLPLKATEWKNVSTEKKEEKKEKKKEKKKMAWDPVSPIKKAEPPPPPPPARADWQKLPDKKPVVQNGNAANGAAQKIKELEARIIKLQQQNEAQKKAAATSVSRPPPEYLENRIAYRSSESINKTISPVLSRVMQTYYQMNARDESINGNVVLSFKIKNTGEIFWLKISYKTIENKKLLDFVMDEFKKCRFDPVDPKTKPVSMVYPLIFKPLDD